MNNLSQNQKKILIVVIIIVVGIIGYYVYSKDESEVQITDEEIMIKNNTTEENAEESEELEKIKVHIMGAVKNAGVVELNENSRIDDAINAAGGLTKDANMDKINLAYVLEDGVKIRIPSVNDKETEEEYISTDGVETVDSSIAESTESENSKTSKVNINKADQAELETLPGVGSATAEKIINYRNENGKFSSIEDIKNVNGIGDSKFENLKDLICVK